MKVLTILRGAFRGICLYHFPNKCDTHTVSVLDWKDFFWFITAFWRIRRIEINGICRSFKGFPRGDGGDVDCGVFTDGTEEFFYFFTPFSTQELGSGIRGGISPWLACRCYFNLRFTSLKRASNDFFTASSISICNCCPSKFLWMKSISDFELGYVLQGFYSLLFGLWFRIFGGYHDIQSHCFEILCMDNISLIADYFWMQ